jgi:hypothetical protein
MTVNFKFEIDQKVKVEKLGITGIVAMCAFDEGGNTYYVKTPDNDNWFRESLLVDAERDD